MAQRVETVSLHRLRTGVDHDRDLGSPQRVAAAKRISLMCAEAVPWRCHRSLIADALVAKMLTADRLTQLLKMHHGEFDALMHPRPHCPQ